MLRILLLLIIKNLKAILFYLLIIIITGQLKIKSLKFSYSLILFLEYSI